MVLSLSLLAKLAGVFGLVMIIIGVVIRKEIRQDIFFIVGSASLLLYSLYLKDFIFIILQIVFLLVAAWELWSIKSGKRKN